MNSIRQGELYWADLDPVVGREQAGARPVLVVSRDEINRRPLTVLVMVGTGAERVQERYATDFWVTSAESGLPNDTVFLGLQLRSVDPRRLRERIGRVAHSRLPELWDALRYLIGDDR